MSQDLAKEHRMRSLDAAAYLACVTQAMSGLHALGDFGDPEH
jgi:hypothetical protein